MSSPYLEAAIRDVLPGPVPLVRLAGPSMCPGHYDLRPSQLSELSRCRLLVRFDFQSMLDNKLADCRSLSANVLPVAIAGGLCEPDSYRSACRQIADYFVKSNRITPLAAERRLVEIDQRLNRLAEEIKHQIDEARLRGEAVLTSGHQEAFCRWLGLRPVAIFSATDTAGTGQIDQVVKAGASAGVKLIIANQPEGRRLADALAERLAARVVMFANFPQTDQPEAFDNLIRQNLAALVEAGRNKEQP